MYYIYKESLIFTVKYVKRFTEKTQMSNVFHHKMHSTNSMANTKSNFNAMDDRNINDRTLKNRMMMKMTGTIKKEDEKHVLMMMMMMMMTIIAQYLQPNITVWSLLPPDLLHPSCFLSLPALCFALVS